MKKRFLLTSIFASLGMIFATGASLFTNGATTKSFEVKADSDTWTNNGYKSDEYKYYSGDYYNASNVGDSAVSAGGTTLLEKLNDLIKPSTAFGYSNIWTFNEEHDCYPNDYNGVDSLTGNAYPTTDNESKRGKLWDMYSNKNWNSPGDRAGNYTYVGDKYNREHSFPKSWFGDSNANTIPGTDPNHLFNTDGKVNGLRSNYAFGEVSSPNQSWTKGIQGAKATPFGKLGPSSTSGMSAVVYEPDDAYKGDFARAQMYMAVAYYNWNLTQDGDAQYCFTYSGGVSTMKPYYVNLLTKWSNQDPVSQKEIDRNNAVYASKQKNRNPFIDHPGWANKIWGGTEYTWGKGSTSPTVDSVTVSPDVLNLTLASTEQLTATVSVSGGAAQTVNWSSSNPSVATVSSTGLVTAVGVGTATITATSTYDTSVSGSCAVIVGEPTNVDVTAINASISPALIAKDGSASVTISSIVPSNAYPHPTYTYESGNPSIATVDTEGTVSAIAAGSTSITVKAYQGSVLKASTSLTVQVYEGGSSTTFEKVTSNLTDFSGRYLITNASETSATVLDGSNPGPASSNHFTASVSSGKIEHTENKYFDIVKSGSNYAIKGTNDMYIGSGSSNTLTTSESPLETTISVSDGSATITHNGKVLRYNTASGGLFRYYSSGQQPITLFKASQSVAGDPKIGLDKTVLTLVNGQSESIEATTLLGDGVVSWSISDETVIQLDDIEDKSVTVNAIKEGTATLTASYDAGVSATCEITVGEAPVIATSLVATYSGDNILKGGKLDLSKVSAKLYYSDSTSVDLTASDLTFYIGGSQVSDIANYVFNSVGDVSVTVSNHGLTSSFVIHVVNPSSPDTPVGPGNDTNQDSNIDINNGTNGSGAGQVMPILLIVIFGTAVFAGGFLLVYFLIIKKKR